MGRGERSPTSGGCHKWGVNILDINWRLLIFPVFRHPAKAHITLQIVSTIVGDKLETRNKVLVHFL